MPPSTDVVLLEDLHDHGRAALGGLEQLLGQVEVLVGVVALADLVHRAGGRRPGPGAGARSPRAHPRSRAVSEDAATGPAARPARPRRRRARAGGHGGRARASASSRRDLLDRAYEDGALAIGCGQTISQPLVVARMVAPARAEPDDRVLDVGTGSGYHAAVLARLAGHVWTIERHRPLAERAAAALRDAGVENVTVLVGDGSQGLPEHAPVRRHQRRRRGARLGARAPRGLAGRRRAARRARSAGAGSGW